MTASHLIRQPAQTQYLHYSYRTYEGFFFFFCLPQCALFIILHEWNFFSVVDMWGSWLFHVAHGADPAGSLGTHCISCYKDTTVQVASLIHMHPWSQTETCTHETIRTYIPVISGILYIFITSYCCSSLCNDQQ